jgi:glycosyltransferase involved in cell wall biosynthesis
MEICHELNRRGHHAVIYTTNCDGDGGLDVPLGLPIEMRGVEVSYFSVRYGNYYKMSIPLARALKRNIDRYDLVHIHALYQFPSSAAAHYCRKYGIPYIVQPHGSMDPYLYRRHPLRKRLYEALVERRSLASAAAVHFTTEEEMRLAQASGLRFQGVVAPLGVEIEQELGAAPEAANAIWPQLTERKVVLFLSRINFKKGMDILARAFGEALRAFSDAHLVIAGPGDGAYSAQVRRWLADEGALDAVTFAGMVRGSSKAALLSRADIFVLPSYSENFGIAIVEAMAAGLPVVISNRVNIWRDIDAASAGIVVNPDIDETAKAIIALLTNPSEAKEMGARGRRLAHEKFSWRAAGDRIVRMYEQVIAAHSAGFAETASAVSVN